MNTKLILVEGIPGSGKTTIAKKIHEYLDGKSIASKSYTEGELHPADLAWLSYMSCYEYNELLSKYPEYKEKLVENSIIEEDYALVAYTKIGLPRQSSLLSYLQTKEIFDGKLSIQEFLDINLKRWRQFCQKAISEDTVYIFECAFLQNHINELIAINDADDDYIIEYFKKLLDTVKQLNPKLIYLDQTDIKKTIDHIAKERVPKDSLDKKGWIDFFIEYITGSNYGKKYSLNGYNGVINYLSKRVKAEKSVINHLDISAFVVTRNKDDWDKLMSNIYRHLERIFS